MNVATLVLADVGERLGSAQDSVVEAGEYVALRIKQSIICISRLILTSMKDKLQLMIKILI